MAKRTGKVKGNRRGKAKRNYKDSVFRMLFGSDKKELLNLYNAINGTSYRDAGSLEINTLEDAIYVGMKNDISFVFQDRLSLYEHQSSLNPNLPLRDLFYVADLLQEMTEVSGLNLYSTTIQMIDAPHFVMFYNGAEDPGNITEYRLSDMFKVQEEKPSLELIVRIVHVHSGNGGPILQKCPTLMQYARFVEMVRRNLRKKLPLREALSKAVDECIEKGILKDFLTRHKAQVIKVSIYEFDEEQYIRWNREEGSSLRIIVQMEKKMRKGKNLTEICEDLEEDEERLAPIYKILLESGYDADPEDVLKKLLQKA